MCVQLLCFWVAEFSVDYAKYKFPIVWCVKESNKAHNSMQI